MKRGWIVTVFTIPNAITIGRGVFGFAGIIIALQPHLFFDGVAIFFFCGMLPDLLDGYLARRYNQKSRIGEFIDPFVDKSLFYGVMFIHFFHYAWIPVLCALFFCDVISTCLHFVKIGGAVSFGKRKFLLQCISLGVFLIANTISKKIFILPYLSPYFFIFVANGILIIALFYAVRSLLQRFDRSVLV